MKRRPNAYLAQFIQKDVFLHTVKCLDYVNKKRKHVYIVLKRVMQSVLKILKEIIGATTSKKPVLSGRNYRVFIKETTHNNKDVFR